MREDQDPCKLAWPSERDVNEATPVQLMRWIRFLPRPKDDNRENETQIMRWILQKWQTVPHVDQVAARKEAGW